MVWWLGRHRLVPCKDNQQVLTEMEQLYAKSPGSTDRVEIAAILASGRQGLLMLLGDDCPVDVRAKIAQDIAALNASAARGEASVKALEAARAARRTAPRPPVLCDTKPKAYGGSTTECF
jgi:hypothetical protein